MRVVRTQLSTCVHLKQKRVPHHLYRPPPLI